MKKPELPEIPRPYAGQTLSLTADQRVVVLREISEMGMGLSVIQKDAKDGEPIDLETAYNILNLLSSKLTPLSRALTLELDNVVEREARSANIRALNERIRELEEQLGRAGTVEQTTAHLELLGKLLNKWWDKHGFGSVREMNFSTHGHVKAKFSCFLHGDSLLRSYSNTPASDEQTQQQWLQSLRDRGFQLCETKGERDLSVVDNDNNRQLLERLFADTFANAKLWNTENHYNRDGVPVLRYVEVIFRDIAEIAVLDGE